MSKDVKEKKIVKLSKQKREVQQKCRKREGRRKEQEELFNLINILELKSKNIYKQIYFIINGPNGYSTYIRKG